MSQNFNPNEEVTLIVHSHGLWCSHENQQFFIDALKKEFESKNRNVVVYAASSNTNHTTEGIMIGAERLAQETYDEIIKIPQEFRQGNKKINLALTGHSMGGIYQRAMLPILLSKPGIMDMVKFKCFMTLDSPHLGSYFYYVKNIFINYLGGQSGRDLGLFSDVMLNLVDKEHMDALALFDHRTLVAVSWGDTLVPFCSASGRLINPYKVPIPWTSNVLTSYFKSFPPAKFELRGYSGFSKSQIDNLGFDPALVFDPPTVESEVSGSNQSIVNDKKHWLHCNENIVNTYEGIFKEFCNPKKREDDLFPEEHFWKRLDVSFGSPDKMGLRIHESVIGKKQDECDIPACSEAIAIFVKIIEQDTK